LALICYEGENRSLIDAQFELDGGHDNDNDSNNNNIFSV
jgi:hypothetical protein